MHNFKSHLIYFLLLALVFASFGCNANSRVDWYNNANQQIWADSAATIAAPMLIASGKTEILGGLTLAVHGGLNCSDEWYCHLRTPEQCPSVNFITCALSGPSDVIFWLTKGGIDVNTIAPQRPKAVKLTEADITDEIMDYKKQELHDTVAGFDAVSIPPPEEK